MFLHSILHQLPLINFSQEQSINVNFIGALAEHKSQPKTKKKKKKNVLHSILHKLPLINFSQEQSINLNFIGALAEHKSAPKKK